MAYKLSFLGIKGFGTIPKKQKQSVSAVSQNALFYDAEFCEILLDKPELIP